MATTVSFGKYAPLEKEPQEFDISFALDNSAKTIVPLGILDAKNNYENPYFAFRYTLTGAKINQLNFEITDEQGNAIYTMGYLEPIIVIASRKSDLTTKAHNETPKLDTKIIMRSWDYESVFKQYKAAEPEFTEPGSYIIHWDGFDTNEVYDSKRFDGKKLKAKITAIKDGKQKSIEVFFTTSYDKVKWTDVKIDRTNLKVEISLRVNLKDGGEKGFSKEYYRDPLDDPRMPAFRERHDWDKIPKDRIQPGKPPLTSRTRSYEDLKNLAIDGLKRHWSRSKSNGLTVGNKVSIGGKDYQVSVLPENQDSDKAMDDLPLYFNTNGDWMRSGNPGSGYSDDNLDDNVVALLPDGVMQRLSFNAGYIHHSNWKNNPWPYVFSANEDINFKETAAHEIGHEILQAYYGTTFSWQHKGSSYYLPQDTKPIKGQATFGDKITHWDEMKETSGEYYPKAPSEIDLMKYYHEELDKSNRLVSGGDPNRTVAAEADVLGLMWLTKIKIK